MKLEHMLYIIIIFLIIFNIISVSIAIYEKSHYVHNTKCNKPLGEFSVEPGITSSQVSYACDGKCTFTNISTLYDAAMKCNVMSKVCDRFVYDSSTGIMSFINLKSELSESLGSDLYTRQVGVTYKNN